MQVELKVGKTDLTGALRTYVERRLRFALSRFRDRVGRVEVKISDNSAARAIKSCRVTVELKPFGRLSVEESGLDLYAAIDRATGRLGRVMARRIARAQESQFGRETVRAAA